MDDKFAKDKTLGIIYEGFGDFSQEVHPNERFWRFLTNNSSKKKMGIILQEESSTQSFGYSST